MSDAVEQMGCIRHRETARYFTYYEDYQEFSKQHSDKLAAFLRVLEVKTNKKLIAFESILEDAVLNGKTVPDLNLWLEISYNDFVYWSLKTMGRSSFQVADKEAEKMFLAKSRVCKRHIRPDDPESAEVQYKEYLLILENVQAMIDGKELPITGQAYEDYGNTPPVIENIPLLKKTWGMLQKTREALLKKTAPPVEKNRLINKYISNLPKESDKDTTLVDSPAFVDSANAEIDESPSESSLLEKPLHEENVSPQNPVQVEQPQLIEHGPPVMPATTAKWNAETVVQIVEAKRNKRFEEVVRVIKGKPCKTQRERQLEAAKVVIQGKFTREQFERAYDYRNDDWWIERKGDLTVVDMIANTSKHVMRLIEVLEDISVADKKGKRGKAIAAPAQTPRNINTTSTMSHDQAIQLANTVVAQGKEHGLNIQARATSTSSNAWVVNASWNGNRLPSITSQAFWDKYLVELKLIAEDDAAEQKGAN